MALIELVVLCAGFLGAFAASDSSNTCRESSEGQKPKDGYELLQKGVTFALAKVSTKTLIVSGIKCIRATTTEKNDNHTFLERFTFKIGGDSWQHLEQRFRFLNQGGPYNIMTPIGGTGNSERQQEQQGGNYFLTSLERY
uniref:Putative salivary lipocalin n=1 Tax=Rhipicephalus pulchellus TaxID=72859 RepID=L7LPK5_RHIPC